MNLALGLTPVDFPRAYLWAHWLRALGGLEKTTLYLSATPNVSGRQLKAFLDILEPALGSVDFEYYSGEDPGYPAGANRIFLFTLRRSSASGHPTLWVESDWIPLVPDWLAQLTADYAAQGKPFYGPHLKIYDIPHMNGTAIYPANWDQITELAKAPDLHPWDTWSRHTVVGQKLSYDTPLMQHSFDHGSFPRDLDTLEPEAIAYHPCKDGSLIRHLDKGRLPPAAYVIPATYYLMKGYNPAIERQQIPADHVEIHVPGGLWAAFAATTFRDYALLTRIKGLREITREDYLSYVGRYEGAKV
jgi:hypothetical protein